MGLPVSSFSDRKKKNAENSSSSSSSSHPSVRGVKKASSSSSSRAPLGKAQGNQEDAAVASSGSNRRDPKMSNRNDKLPLSSTTATKATKSNDEGMSEDAPMERRSTRSIDAAADAKKQQPGEATVISLSSYPSPVVGQLVRVFEEGWDAWGARPQAAGWFPATIVKVNKKKQTESDDDSAAQQYVVHTMTHFDDQTESEHDYPSRNIEPVFFGTGDDCHILYSLTGEEVLNTRPDRLGIGDLVFCKYQNGNLCDASNQGGRVEPSWFRGRVTSVGKANNPQGRAIPVCDIIYDDQDYERNVPFGKEMDTVYKIQDGQKSPSWMEGIAVESSVSADSSESPNSRIVQRKVIKAETDRAIVMEFTKEDGRTTPKKGRYKVVAKLILDDKVARLPKKKKQTWPVLDTKFLASTTTVFDIASKDGVQSSRKGGNKKRAATSYSTKKGPVTKKPRAKKASSSDSDDKEQGMTGAVANAKQPATTKPRRATKCPPKPPPSTDDDDDDDDDDESVEPVDNESDYDAYDSMEIGNMEEDETAMFGGVIDRALENTFNKMLNSCSTKHGTEFLTFMTAFHRQTPSDELISCLLHLLTHGPKSGSTYFPDCYRMDVAFDYVSFLLKKPGMKKRFSDNAGADYCLECLYQLESKFYEADGDENRINKDAVERIGQSVHAKAYCAEMFLTLLEYQIKLSRQSGKNGDVEGSILRGVIHHRRGPKEALEKFARVCIRHWIKLGHFIFGDLPEVENIDDGPSKISLEFIHIQARRLLGVLGQVVSLMASIYGRKANEDIKAVGRIINNIVLTEIQETSFDPSPFLNGRSCKEYWKSIKLQFLLDLDKRIVPHLRPTLAGSLGVARKYNAIFG